MVDIDHDSQEYFSYQKYYQFMLTARIIILETIDTTIEITIEIW